jgi:hypothetical protein
MAPWALMNQWAPGSSVPRGGAYRTEMGSIAMMTHINRSVSRRSAVAGLAGGSLAFAGLRLPATAAQSQPELATHPIVGTWLAGRAPNDIAVAHWGPDGSMTTNLATVSVAPDGKIAFNDPPLGSWVPISARGIHFIFTDRTYDATGAHTG